MAKKKTATKKTAATEAAASPDKPSYDAIPYVGRPRLFAHPDDLATRAHLFGLPVPDVEKARVLEIGCGDGANLLSIAATLPDTVCVGIDQSAPHIKQAEEMANAAEINNLYVSEMDFQDLPAKPEELYDFIITHGLYSWVDEEAQATLIEKIKSHLAPDGVAFVSYNCYPGWHLRQIVRQFLLYHTAGVEDPKERVKRCRTAIPLLVKSIPTQLQGYASLLAEEQQLLEKASDDYIFHDHLEQNNHPCYFHEFAERLESSGLQFLCEAELSSMHANRYPLSLANLAKHEADGENAETALDPVKSEQYLDFSRLRMFRQSVIVHADREVVRNLDPAKVRSLSACAFGAFQQNQSMIDDQPETFQSNKGVSITTSNPLAKSAMRVLAENWPSRVPFEELETSARALLASASGPAVEADKLENSETAISELLLAAATADIVDLYTTPARYTTSISDKPVASPLARAQSSKGNEISTLRHRSLKLSSLGQKIIALLDGSNDHDALAEAILKLVEDGSIILQENGQAVTDPEQQKRLAAQQVGAMLNDFARGGMLSG